MRPGTRRIRMFTGAVLALAVTVGVTAVPDAGEAATAHPGSGYWMLGEDGLIYPFGTAPLCGDISDDFYPSVSPPYEVAVDIAATPDGRGYWVLESGGYVGYHHCDYDDFRHPQWDYIHNEFVGSMRPDEEPVSISATPDGGGYWVFTDKGRAIPLGTAQWFGDMGTVALNGPILDSVATPSGRGYWMVASDGGIFAFGDAQFYGSMGGQRLNAPVMSMAPDPDGAGYWLVASDGGIFAFAAPFYGSMGATRLNQPISGIVGSPTGAGYLMVAFDGGIFAFGDVPFHGSLGATPPAFAVISVAVMP